MSYYYYCPFFRPNGEGMAQIVAPQTVQAYVGQTIMTTIPGYGRVRAFVLSFNNNTGMAQLLIATPWGGQQYLEVHHQDMIGITPVLAGGGGMGGGMGGGQGQGQGQGQGFGMGQGLGGFGQGFGGFGF